MGTRGTKSPKEVVRMLLKDGWYEKRKGPGDHVQYMHQKKPGRVSIDMGSRDIPMGTLRNIYRMAGWEW